MTENPTVGNSKEPNSSRDSRTDARIALAKWIVKVCEKENATPEEIAALPGAAHALFTTF